ncbi:MAG: aldehyde dehydrogenase family protein, partial [Rhodothermales bacterium]|nr:aldehyde dehydrogenase family protein [Rhodothermales bacterium]
MSLLVEQSVLSNYIGGREVASSSSRLLPLTAPNTGELITDVPMSRVSDLDAAVQAAAVAQKAWAEVPMKDRVQVLYRFKTLIERDEDRLCEVVTLENGKTMGESRGSVLRGVECVEFATSLPQIAPGAVMEVSPGVQCRTQRVPMGVVAGITPFNFPFMVPLWMVPMALGLWNAFVLKPSEET